MNEFSVMKKMSLMDIIKYSFLLYKKIIFKTVLVILIFFAASYIVNLTTLIFVNRIKEISDAIRSDTQAYFNKYVFELMIIVLINVFIIFCSLMIIFFYKIFIVKSAYQLITVDSFDAKDILRGMIKDFKDIILTYLSMSVLLALFMLLCVIPGIFFMFVIIFMPQVIAVENTYYSEAFKRSFAVLKKGFFSSMLIIVIFYLFLQFAVYSVMFIFNFNQFAHIREGLGFLYDKSVFQTAVEQFITMLISIFVQPLLHIALTVKFLNIKNLLKMNKI